MSVRIEHTNEVMRKYFLDFFLQFFLLLLLKPRCHRRCLLSLSLFLPFCPCFPAVSIYFSIAVPVSFSFVFCYYFLAYYCCVLLYLLLLASSLWGVVPRMSAPALLAIGERVFIFPFSIFVFQFHFLFEVIVRIYSWLPLAHF